MLVNKHQIDVNGLLVLQLQVALVLIILVNLLVLNQVNVYISLIGIHPS